jgi:hypothetical protein
MDAMRYSSCDSTVDLWEEVVRDEHICISGVNNPTQCACLFSKSEGTDHVKGIRKSIH